jgi:hypothetical protein
MQPYLYHISLDESMAASHQGKSRFGVRVLNVHDMRLLQCDMRLIAAFIHAFGFLVERFHISRDFDKRFTNRIVHNP